MSGTAGPAFLAAVSANVAVSAEISLERSPRRLKKPEDWWGPLAFFNFAMQAKRLNSKPCLGPL